MNEHELFEELLPLYAAGQLSGSQKTKVEAHLQHCNECQSDLAMWRGVSLEIQAENQDMPVSSRWAEEALKRVHAPNPFQKALKQAWQLLRAQALLVKSEMWPVTALVMLIGILVSVVAKKTVVIYFLSPVLAASTLAVLYGPDHDPAMELSRATATSPWKILFARMSIVSSYNVLLGFLASLVLLFIVPPETLWTLILGWLGPLAFLSALALLISIWLGTGSAITISYSLWLIQFIPFSSFGTWTTSGFWTSALSAYRSFWHNPILLIILSVVVVAVALWSANQPASRMIPSNQ